MSPKSALLCAWGRQLKQQPCMMLVGPASVHRLLNASEKSSELVSEVPWGREQTERLTFPQKPFPQRLELATSPTPN